MLFAAVEKELGIADRLAPLITDPHNPLLVTQSVGRHTACGHAGDCVVMRTPATLTICAPTLLSGRTCGRLPDSGRMFAHKIPSRAGSMP
jgi:hypothetical protein